MTERAPTGQSTLEKKRDKLAQQREKLEYDQRILEGEEAFGKYDSEVTPAEGELTYEQYLAQRPAEGIVRSYDGYRDAQTGKFAGQDAYELQYEAAPNMRSDADRIEAAIKSNEGKTFELPYAGLGFAQLAREYSLAKSRVDSKGNADRTAMEDIKEALKEFLEQDIIATSTDEESSVAAQERYDYELARFDGLVAGFDKLRHQAAEAAPSESAPQEPKPEEVEPVEPEEEASEAAVPQGEPLAEEQVVEVEAAPNIVMSAESEWRPIEGEIKRSQPDYSDRATALPDFDDISVPLPAAPVRVSAYNRESIEPTQAPEKPELVEDSNENAKPDPSDQSSEKPAEVEASRGEKIREWFYKKGGMREKLGVNYWRDRWHRPKGEEDKVLEHGVTEADSEDERERKKKRNRHIALLGAGVVLAGAAIAGGIFAGNAVNNSAAEKTMSVELTYDEGTTKTLASPEIEEPVSAPEAPPIAPEVFNIPNGGGGEQLFNAAGIDASVWYNNEDALLTQFPNDFYRMSDGHVGIAQPGSLSQGAQDYIQNLK